MVKIKEEEKPTIPMVADPPGHPVRRGVRYLCACGQRVTVGHFNQCKVAQADERIQTLVGERVHELWQEVMGVTPGLGTKVKPDPALSDELRKTAFALGPPLPHTLLSRLAGAINAADDEQLRNWMVSQEKAYFSGRVTACEAEVQYLMKALQAGAAPNPKPGPEAASDLSWKAPGGAAPEYWVGPGWVPPAMQLTAVIKKRYGADFDLFAQLIPISAATAPTKFLGYYKDPSKCPVHYESDPVAVGFESVTGVFAPGDPVITIYLIQDIMANGAEDSHFPDRVDSRDDASRRQTIDRLNLHAQKAAVRKKAWTDYLKSQTAGGPNPAALIPVASDPESDGSYGDLFDTKPTAKPDNGRDEGDRDEESEPDEPDRKRRANSRTRGGGGRGKGKGKGKGKK